RPASEPTVAADDGEQPDDQDAGEDFAADMGSARGKLGKLDLNGGRYPLHQRPAPLRQRKQRLPTFGEGFAAFSKRLATLGGQSGESTCDRLVHSGTGPRQARPSALVRPP